MSRHDVITLLYIVAFSFFIAGLHMLRGPRTAVRGNQVAAVGMAIAVAATLAQQGVGDWLLILIGVGIGTAIGVPAARSVKMTAMPQMVALFNGVGGGAVALISWAEFRSSDAFSIDPTYVALKRWRLQRSKSDEIPAYVVFHNATLAEIAARRPSTIAELASVPGVGPAKLERYGEEVLKLFSAPPAVDE